MRADISPLDYASQLRAWRVQQAQSERADQQRVLRLIGILIGAGIIANLAGIAAYVWWPA